VKEARLYVAFYVALLLARFTLHTTLLLWVWIVPLIVGQFSYALISMPNTPAANGRAAPFRTPAPLTTGMLMRWFAWNMPYQCRAPRLSFDSVSCAAEVERDRR